MAETRIGPGGPGGRWSTLDDGRVLVAEPDVKARLAAAGVPVPTGVVVDGTLLGQLVGAGLRSPLVLKAFGPGLVHKTDVGAVALGVDHASIPTTAAAITTRLRVLGLAPAGFLLEEQAGPGIELIVGVVRRPPFGLVVALGLGGTLTEIVDQVGLALFPLSEADARRLVATFPGHASLDGVRGGPPADREALVRVVLAIAGPAGVVAELGDAVDELECNPVRVGPGGAVALDARLVLRAVDPLEGRRRGVPPTDPALLFRPRAVAVAGASTNRPGFGNRALAAYRAAGWTDGLFAIHPTATEVDGVPAHPTVAATGAPVDYLLVAVPAERCADVVRETAGAVPFVQVVSGGFGEVGPDGDRRADELVLAARAVGCRLLGPNCMGVYAPAGRQTFLLGAPVEPGHVGVVSQSGGLSGDIIQTGARRGLRFSAVASVGNAVDVTPGEVASWLLDDPDTHVLGVYLEGTADTGALVAALRRAQGHTPVAVLLGGSSDQGALAVASHTGSLVGDRRTWEAVATSTGATIVGSLEHLLAVLVHLQRWAHGDAAPAGDGGGVLVVGVGGGASVLATDACDRAGLELTPTPEPVRAQLRDLGYGVGTSVANPLEIPFGPVAPTDALRRVLRPVVDGAGYADVLVHVNVAAYYSYGDAGLAPLLAQLDDLVAADLPARVAVVARNLECATGVDADGLRAHAAELGLSLHADLDQAAVAIAAVRRFAVARAERAAGAGA